MFWAHLQVGIGLYCCFFFNFNYYFRHSFLWKNKKCKSSEGGHRHKKKRPEPDTYSEVKPRREWRNQGLIWSKCPQAQTIWQPESDGFTKTIIHHFSPVSNQLAGLLWAAAPLHTMFDTLMDNGETLPPYGKKISHDLECFLFFPLKHSPNDLGKHVVDAGQSRHRLAKRQWLSYSSLQEFWE